MLYVTELFVGDFGKSFVFWKVVGLKNFAVCSHKDMKNEEAKNN